MDEKSITQTLFNMYTIRVHLRIKIKKIKTGCIIFLTRIDLVRNQRKLPSYYPRCYRDDPNLNECLLKATETMKPFLKKGVPELNVPPISPFTIPEVVLEQGTNSINYKAVLKNLIITGLDTYHFTKFDFDVPNLKFNGAVDMGELNIKGDYLIRGKILTVPIEGKGAMVANITNSNGTLTQQAKLVVKKGVTYLESEKTNVTINVGEVESQLNGLFDGNEVLAKATNDMVRDNLKLLIEEVRPAVEEMMTKIIEDILFKSVSRVPFDKLYPMLGKKT